MTLDVREWLEGLGLSEYAQAFDDNDIDEEVLVQLTAEDLKDVGVASVGHRRRLLSAISALDRPGETGDDVQPPGSKTSSPATAGTKAERRLLTVLFCDLVGSTALSRQLDPEDLRDIMRQYQDAVSGSVARYGGHVAKFLGDGVLAYFGWPQAHEDQAERAVRASLDAVHAVRSLKTVGDLKLDARVGISTGQVVVGDLVGTDSRDADTVIGETPNLAARLQAQAMAGQILLGPDTRRLIGASFDLVDAGPQVLKGFDTPVPAWRVRGEGAVDSRFAAAGHANLGPFVGRGTERQLLIDRWRLACSGEGQIMCLSGEAGIGKSRLLEQLLHDLEGERYFRLRYQCSPHHVASAFYPIIRRLERAAGFRPDDPAETRLDKLEELLRLAGDVETDLRLYAALLSLPGEQRYGRLDFEPQQQRTLTIEALIGQLQALSRQRPIAFVLEDAHWIDPSTLSFLEQVAVRIDDWPVLLVVTHRTEWQAPFGGLPHATTLALSQISRSAVTQLVTSIAGTDVAADFVEKIAERAGGIPLFVEELTKSLLEVGYEGDREQVPQSLQASLQARLDRLDQAKSVAQIGSVIGRSFGRDVLAEVARLPLPELDAGLEKLAQSGLVMSRGSGSAATYQFKHALIQDAAYTSLLRSTRQDLHGRLAHVLETSSPVIAETEPELLAYHYSHAGCPEKAVDYWMKAGRKANAACAFLEGKAHFRNALAALSQLPKSAQRDSVELQLQIALAAALQATEGFAASATVEAFERARVLCDTLDDGEEILPVYYGTFRYLSVAGRHVESHELAGEALQRAERIGDPVHVMMARRMMGTSLYTTGKLVESRQAFEAALALYDEAHDDRASAIYGKDYKTSYLVHLVQVLFVLGYADQAASIADAESERTRQLGHAFTTCHALFWFTYLFTHRREPEKAHLLLAELRDLAQKKELFFWYNASHALDGAASLLTGDLVVAGEQLELTLDTLKRLGVRILVPHWLSMLAWNKARLGRHGEAVATIVSALEMAQTTGESWLEPELLRIRAAISLAGAAADRAAAEVILRQSIDAAQAMKARSWELRATTDLSRLLAETGERRLAADLLRPIHDWFTEGRATLDLIEAKGLLDELG